MMLLRTLKRFCGVLGFLFTGYTTCHGDRAILHTKGFSYQSVTCLKTEAETQLCISLSFPQKSMIKKRIDINFLLLLC